MACQTLLSSWRCTQRKTLRDFHLTAFLGVLGVSDAGSGAAWGDLYGVQVAVAVAGELAAVCLALS